MRTAAKVLLLILALASPAAAAPLNLSEVPADAQWLVHADFDALRTSTVFSKAQEAAQDKLWHVDAHLAKFHQLWNLDPRKDLHSVTLFGVQFKRHAGAAIIRGKLDRPFLVNKANKWPDYQVSHEASYELHTWTMHKGSHHERHMAAAFYAPDVLVVGFSREEVLAALAALTPKGTNVSLAGKATVLSEATAPGTIVVARAIGLTSDNFPCQSPLLKQSQSLSLAVGEHQGEAFFTAKMVTKSAEVAQQMKTVVEGMCASAVLRHEDEPKTLALVHAARISAAGKTLSVEWRAPAAAIWPQIEALLPPMPPRHDRHFGPERPPHP